MSANLDSPVVAAPSFLPVDVSSESIIKEICSLEAIQLGAYEIMPVAGAATGLTAEKIADAFTLFRQSRERHAPLLEEFRNFVFPEEIASVEEVLRNVFELFFLLALSSPVASLIFYSKGWLTGFRAELNVNTLDGISQGNAILSLKGAFDSEELKENTLVVVAYVSPSSARSVSATAPPAAEASVPSDAPDRPETKKITVELKCAQCNMCLIRENIAEIFVASKCEVCSGMFCCRCHPGFLSTDIQAWRCPVHVPTVRPGVEEIEETPAKTNVSSMEEID